MRDWEKFFKKLDKDAILSDTSLVGDINPDNLEKSSNSVQSALFTHEGGLEKIEKLKDVFSDANLISDGIPDNDNTLVDSVPSSIEMTDNPIVAEESTNDISESIIIPRTAGTGSEHSTSANSPTVSNMTVSSESSKHSRSGSQTRKKGPPPKVPPKSGKVVNWIPQKKENDLPKQNPEAPLKKVPSSNQLEELQDQNNTRLKNKIPPDTLQETNNSSEVLSKEVEIKDRSNIISKKDIEPLDVSQETNNSEINLSKQNPETPFKELKEEETASRNSSHTIPEIDLSKQQPEKTLRDSYQTKPEEHMTFESIYEGLAKKGIVENNPPPAIPPKPNVSTSYEPLPEVMNLDEIHKQLGLSDSQSTPMPYLPNNNLPDSKDENAPPSTDDKTNSLVITSVAPPSQFSIGTYENPPLINNDNNEMSLDEINKQLGLSDSQSTSMPFLPNNNLPDSKDENAPPSTDDKTNSLVITSAASTSQFSIGTYENSPLINIDNNEMSLDEINKRLGLSDSHSTSMPFLPNNNRLDTPTSQTKDNNTLPLTDDKTNSLVITPSTPYHFNIGTDKNRPLINNEMNFDSQSTSMPFVPNNNLPDTPTFRYSTIEDNNTLPLTDDKTNSLEITPSTRSHFNIGTDKNRPLINNEISNPVIMSDPHTFQPNTSEDNNNTVTISATLPSQSADTNIPPRIDIGNDSKEQSTSALIINNNPLENSILDFSNSSSPIKDPVDPVDSHDDSYLPQYNSSSGPPTLSAPNLSSSPFDDSNSVSLPNQDDENSTLVNSVQNISREEPEYEDSTLGNSALNISQKKIGHEDSTFDYSAHDFSRKELGFVDNKQLGDHSTNDTPRSNSPVIYGDSPLQHQHEILNPPKEQSVGIVNAAKNMIGGTISRIMGKDEDKYTECVQITFHVHLPPHIERFGEPVIVGNCKELGSWKMVTILLTQPHKREHPTYWRSHPVEIQLGRDEIKYKYGVFNRGSGRVEFEGEGERQNRTLDTRTNDQYDIWQNNRRLYIFDLNEFAFVRCICDAVNNENLKDKVMQFQLLLTNHRTHALNFITLDFITQRYQKKEKRLFLCVLLGYFIKSRKDPRVFTFQLPKQFRSELLLEALEHVQQDTFTSDIKPIMAPVVAALVRHNTMEMVSFEWLKIFRVAQFVDPAYTFVDGFIGAHYGKEKISRLLKEWPKIVKPHLDRVDERTYIKISKWLISCCSNMETLNIMWRDNIDHTLSIDNEIAPDFTRSVYTIIAQDNTASALYANFGKVIPEFRMYVVSLFRDQTIHLLKNQQGGWDQQNLQSLGKLLKDGNLHSEREHFIRALECVSQSTIYNLLNMFPDLLEYWLNSKFSNSRSQDVLKICQQWFTRIISNLNYNYNMSLNEGGRFIYNVYEYLTRIQSLLTERSNIYKELLHAASERIKKCSHNHILFATVQIAKFNKSITHQFYNLVTENVLVAKEIRRIDKNLIEMICLICGQNNQNKANLENLDVPNSISENLLCHILTCLESQTPQIHTTDQQLDLIKHTDFWRMIFNAKNSVTILHKHSHVMKIRTAISNLASAIVDRTIDIKTLQAILSKCRDEQLYKCLNVVNNPNAKKTFQSVVITESNISTVRKECNAYEERLRHLKAFYSTFCPPNKVVDSDIYTRDLEAKLKILSNVSLNETLSPHYWERHEDVIQKAADIYEFANSKTFINIYETHLSQITDEVNVNYVINTLVPEVHAEHNKIFKNYKEKKWMQVKYSEAFPLWKGVTDIKTELELISKVTYLSKSNKDLENSLKHLTTIPKWEERLQKLSAVVEIFKVPIKTEDWLGRSLTIIRDDMLLLGKVAEFVRYVNENNPIDNENYWSLIKELASASDLLDFLQTIAEHDIKNLINGVDDFSDERLIQEDTVSSLIQVKQLVVQLMNKANKIGEFLKVIQKVSQENPSLPNKITVCAGFNMALQNMLRNISNRGEVTKEKIQNAVLIGIYTFEKVDKSDKFTVTLVYQAKGADKIKHNMIDLQDLRGRALLIAKPANMDANLTEEDKSSKIMNEFVLQVDTAQEILNVGSKLIQMGHFDYRRFKKEIVGTEKRVGTIEMKNLLAKFKEDLQIWKEVVDEAQEQHYYLTFFPARHILAFYDYFTSDVQDDENAEICRTLIKFVNSKAELPSRKDRSGISRKNTDYSRTLKEIGEKLNTIFGKLLKTSRELKVRGERIIADVVDRGKLCVASCNDKLRVPNIIMSLYANHKTYPEPWQVLICTKSTTIEELNIFIKRCFFAAKNGYRDKLFCIANLELLEFELQYGLVENIRSMRERHNDYLLALVCCREGSFHHHILDQFSQDVHSTNGLNAETMKTIYRDLCSNVVCVSSDLSGQGKTEWIKQASFEKKKLLRSFLISDGADFGSLVRQLRKCKLQQFESLHINIISADNSNEINMFLFELLTLGFVSSNVDIASFPQTSAFIEVASTVQQKLLNSLPITGYLVKEHLSWDIRHLNVSSELHGPIQIVCNYLDTYDRNGLNEKDIALYGQNCIKKPLPDQRCRDLIAKYFFEGNADGVSSFRFVEIFVNVLADQLTRLSSSAYFTVENLKLMIKDETTLRTTLVNTLIDVSKDFATRSVKAKAAQLESTSDDYDAKFEIVQWDASNHLLVFFMSQNPDSICALYREKDKVPDNVKEFLRSQCMSGPSKWELEDYNRMRSNLLLERLESLARRTMYPLDLPLYALSADNIIKMALILLRARANVPVVVMGEAGCGKSSLIGYLAKVVEVNYEPFNLHAGIKEQDILDFMDKAQKKADNGELWLFFDEINTCNHIGLLANLIAHRTLQGKLVHPNIRLFSACNPYRKRVKAQSQAGLKTRVRRYEEQSNLVYQVKPLPDQILDYVWDYGVLIPNDEKKYIQIMVQTKFGEGHDLFTELLFSSQQFIRSIEEKYSVSLRDVKRAIKLVDFFNESLRSRQSRNRQYPPNPDNPGRIDFSIRCYILALSLCYQSRIYDQESRNEYRKEMLKIFQRHKTGIKENDFIKVIRDEQEDWIKRMQLPPNTAMNEALLENVLAMIVCILTKIPVFIVGAPGSSKSLAIKLVGQNLRGSDSNDRYFRKLPQAYLISYQGSSSSTSDGIIKVFEKANKYQETSSKEFSVISVVVLDEVGLAETSPHNPLKVLHALLEPNYPSDGPSVSVVGISNWRLDNSKSSRALLVQRPKFGINDLVDTAVRLLDSKLHNSITRSSLRPLAEAYSEYEGCGQSHSNFHGLRDYYGLVKSLSKLDLTPENVQMALERNFGGTDRNENPCGEYFDTVLKTFNNFQEWTYNPIPTLTLIKTNLDDESARHLMVIGKSDSIVTILTYQLIEKGLDPVVILGSQFQDDQQDYSYSVLSRIMMCVEAGRPLILTDLEIIYGALYDLWNQNYIVFGSKNDPKYYTRVALGAYSNPMLYVHKNFRCILVLDEKKLATADPPLLNRFEKQRLTIDDTLTDNHQKIVKILSIWTQQMVSMKETNKTNASRTSFTRKDLFIGFDENETLQSLVINVMTKFPEDNEEAIIKRCKAALIDISSSDGIIRASRSNMDPGEIDQWCNVYFRHLTDEHIPLQNHDSLSSFFGQLLFTNTTISRFIINTFSNINTDISECLRDLFTCQIDKLSTFKTEAQLQNRIKRFWEESEDQMLILQCDVTTVNAGCIKLAKFIIEQFQNEFSRKNPDHIKYVCIILHIQREQNYMSSFNFMCGWKQVTIETLTSQEKNLSTILNGSLADIIKNEYKFEDILKHELLWCLLCIKYPSTSKSVDHIKTLKTEIMKCPLLIECLKTRALEWIEENSSDDWQYKVASDKKLLYPYTSFSAALLAYLRLLVRNPIAKILFVLEKLSATKSFISINQTRRNQDLIPFLKTTFFDPKILNINDLPEPKPDHYVMPELFYDLKFPFSYYFMKKINDFKTAWGDELEKLRENPDNCDDDELSHDAFENAVQGFSENVKTSLPAIKEQVFRDFSEWFFDDFVTVMVANDADKKDSDLLAKLVQLYIGKDKAFDPVLLHIYWWKHSNVISADLQLAQMCPSVINEFMREGPDVSFEEFLVDKVIKMMLDKFAKKGSEPQLDQWQHEVVKILSFSAKILKTNKLRSYQLLRICNDIVSSKLIPLPNIKEIIKLGLDSDEQNVLSKKFVDHVLGILSKLEKNEQNLSLQRSFIMRCLDTIPLDSVVRQHIYNNIFSQKDPFPLMGSIITKIFWKEEDAINEPFLRILQDSKEILQASPRLKVINSALKNNNLDSSMATLCCDIIQKELFVEMNIPEVARYFRHAVQALLEKTFEPLKRISAIAFLKEFVYCMWYQTLQDDYTQPISFIGIMDVGEFDGDVLIEEINNFMSVDNPLIHSLKVYFLRELRHKGLSIDDLKRFCAAHTNRFPWLSTFKWNDNKDTRLPFNPYWQIPEYRQAENAFKELYSIGNKPPFQAFLQQLQNINAFRTRIALIGLIISRLHIVRASREWGASENQVSDFLKIVSTMNNLSTGYKQTIERILSNRQSLLHLDNTIDNINLFLKSVIAHIAALHASIPPESNPLATYFHKIETCQNSFILTTVSDIESLVLSAVIAGGGGQITRYTCQCGYMYVIANCGQAMEAIRCPGCKNNTIGGANHTSAAGNRKLDNAPITGPIKSKDQTGYIGEQPNNSVDHSVRSMPPSSYRILHLIVHALIGLSAHSQATLNFLRMHNQTATNVEPYCLNHIITDWTALRQILNCSDENLALLFHSLLTTMAQSPLPASTLRTSAEREEWETQFTRNYVSPLIRSVTETVTNFRTALVAAAASQGNSANIIESEIDQTRAIDEEYRLSKLPRLWRKIDIVDFNSFRAYYNGDLAQYQIKYPFLAIFFKYFERLEIIKNLHPIIQFVQILSSRLSYRISRKDAEKMTFDEFINKEADRVELYKMFQKFEDSWNLVIDKVDRYQCHELKDKPEINRNMPVIMGVVEAKDLSIYICAILEYLIGLQNNFLRDVMTIPPGSCRSLKFLEQTSYDAEEGISSTAPSQYSIRSLTLNQARIDNIIIYDQEELGGIHMFSQRNLGIGRGLDVIYDLQKIEIELARQLVFEKVYIDTVGETSLYLPPFSYHLELIQVSTRIIGDIRDLIPQEQIPPEHAELMGSSANLPYAFQSNSMDTSLDNPSEILSSLEILLCFIKRTPGGNGESLIKDYVNQWSTLSGLIENHEFRNLLNRPLKLKHIVSLYELIEEQVANLTIDYIHEIYKEELTPKQREEIENLIDLDTKQPATIVNGKIVKFSAEVFATALKRFIYRFLQTEKQKVTDPLYLYICEPSLHLWPPAISELEDLDESFPDSLFVNQAFEAYKFVIDQIEYHKQVVSSREQQIQNQLNNPEATRLPPATPGSQRGPTPRKKPKSRFDML